MVVNLEEYKMILKAITDLEEIKFKAEQEFDMYCAERECTQCAMYGCQCGCCNAELYLKMKKEGLIK